MMQGRMIITKQSVGVDIGKLMEFVDIFHIADMPRIDKVGSHTGKGTGIMLSVIETGQKDIGKPEQNAKQDHHGHCRIFLCKQPFQFENRKHGKVDKEQYRQEENLMVMGHGKKTISLKHSTEQAENHDQEKLHGKG